MREVFVAANLLIAVDYLLIGFYFLRRAPVARRHHAGPRQRRAVVACWAAAVFFFGCMHTHLDLVFLGGHDAHWYTWWNVTSHVAQGVGGFMFWFLARHHLVLNIFDRKAYEHATDTDAEERLQYLAMRAGLVRK